MLVSAQISQVDCGLKLIFLTQAEDDLGTGKE